EVGIALDDAAVVQIAVEDRGFAGIEVPAHGGVDAVGTDQQVTLDLTDGLTGRIDETRDDLVATLLQAGEMMTGRNRLRPQPFSDRRQQDLVQLAARDRNLRPAIAGGLAARLRPDQLPVLVVEGELGGEDADARKLITESQ